MPDDKSDKPINRRNFFRHGLSELLKPLAQVVDPYVKVVNELSKLDAPAPARAPAGPRNLNLPLYLRPPGSLDESAFLKTCDRSGECVRVCPAHCIKIDSTGQIGGGAPYIEANEMACVLCDGLQCMHACPSGALVPTAMIDIDMGTAVWKYESCLLSKGHECRVCVDQCPLGSAAIELKHNQIVVNPHGCIGCGICQHDCPTYPKSIVVIPKAARAR